MKIKNYIKLLLPFGIKERNRIKKLRKKYHLDDSVRISGKLSIGGDFKCREGCKFLDDITINGKVELGRYTSLNGPNTDIWAFKNNVKIGSFCSIARGVSFQEYNHRKDRPSTYFFAKNIFGEPFDKDTNSRGSITIGNDVWIGMHSMILSGADVGHGAIIGANSVVTGEIPPYAIAVGSPAKVIGYRFDVELIKKLLDLNWWDWPIEKIKSNKGFFLESLSQSNIDGIK